MNEFIIEGYLLFLWIVEIIEFQENQFVAEDHIAFDFFPPNIPIDIYSVCN